MAAGPRSDVVRKGEPGIYHVWTRTVRRAYLCGVDPVSGNDFSGRRTWIRQFQEVIAAIFGIEIGFRCEMSNHLHLVLKVVPDVVKHWNDQEVVTRWLRLKRLVRSPDGQTIKEITQQQIDFELAQEGRVEELRLKLGDISEFMKALCEHIARRSNKAEDRKGRFFESRFKCRELLDEAALVTCGIYVDLNEIRAGVASTPETSTHTSAYDRIKARQQPIGKGMKVVAAQVQAHTVDGWMSELSLDERSEAYQPIVPSASGRRASDRGLLPMKLDEYLDLLDWSGRVIKADKSGSISSDLPPILERLGINGPRWLKLVTEFDRLFTNVVGRAESITNRLIDSGRQWYHGQVACREAFG